MGFDEAAMGLRFERWKLHVLGWKPKIDPWGQLRHVDTSLTVEDQLCEDLLNPGRSGLRIGGDDDVIIPEVKIVPQRGIEMIVVKLARLVRPSEFFIFRCIHRPPCLTLLLKPT